MKNALRLIIVTAVLWLLGLTMQSGAAGDASRLDHVLPVALVQSITTEQQTHITDRLARLARPHPIEWIPPICVLLLASYALFAARGTEG
ncbi:MAG TPA: hypothetical protein VF551_07625 [Chthoniobacterales bacterium]